MVLAKWAGTDLAEDFADRKNNLDIKILGYKLQ